MLNSRYSPASPLLVNRSFHWLFVAMSVAFHEPFITMFLARPAWENRKNLEWAMPCGPRQALMHRVRPLRRSGARRAFPEPASALWSRFTTSLGLSGFALPRSTITRTLTLRRWAAISASATPGLRKFQLAIRMVSPRGTLRMVRSTWSRIERFAFGAPSGLLSLTPWGGV